LKTSLNAGFSTFTPKSKESFSKEEKLKSPRQIALVFEQATSIKDFPVLLFYKQIEQQQTPARAAFTVSKKNFKRAVDRNRVKRLMREAYRKNKQDLYDTLGDKNYQLVFVYIGKKIESYSQITQHIQSLHRKLVKL